MEHHQRHRLRGASAGERRLRRHEQLRTRRTGRNHRRHRLHQPMGHARQGAGRRSRQGEQHHQFHQCGGARLRTDHRRRETPVHRDRRHRQRSRLRLVGAQSRDERQRHHSERRASRRQEGRRQPPRMVLRQGPHQNSRRDHRRIPQGDARQSRRIRKTQPPLACQGSRT